MEQAVGAARDALIDALLKSKVYRQYRESAEAIKQHPGVFERILELRSRTIDVYGSEAEDTLMESTELLAAEYEKLQKLPEVNAFLEAEESLIRMLKEIQGSLVDEAELYLP